MRVILDILLLLPALLYQSALAAHFTYRGVGVDLLAVLLASIAINQGWLYGAVGGFAAGLILDCTFGHIGLYALQYMALGMFVGLVNERFRLDTIVLPALLTLAACAAREIVPAVYLYFARATISWGYALLRVLLCAALDAALFVPVHLLLRRLHRWDVVRASLFPFHGRKW